MTIVLTPGAVLVLKAFFGTALLFLVALALIKLSRQ
jgi:hypothetical protein